MSDPKTTDLSHLIAQVRLLYNYEAGNSLQELAVTDPQGARELATAALHPEALAMKHRIDADERAINAG